MKDDDLLKFSYDDEYDENFSEADVDISEREVDLGEDSLNKIDDELLSEMFDYDYEDSLEAEARAALNQDWSDEQKKIEEDEVFEDLPK